MLDGIFEGLNYYNFPSFQVAVYSLLLALVLSSTIAFTYKFTFEDTFYSGNFFQAMVLSSMVSSMVIMAVGNNIAVGFGIIGAVAIIRFRTRVQNPRNIIFIFCAISVGIATGVYGYAIALAGTGIFCLSAILLFFSPYGKQTSNYFIISFTVIPGFDMSQLKDQLISKCQKVELRSIQTQIEYMRIEFLIHINHADDIIALQNTFSEEDFIKVRIEKRNISEEL